jgi:hypothetical protein
LIYGAFELGSAVPFVTTDFTTSAPVDSVAAASAYQGDSAAIIENLPVPFGGEHPIGDQPWWFGAYGD